MDGGEKEVTHLNNYVEMPLKVYMEATRMSLGGMALCRAYSLITIL